MFLSNVVSEIFCYWSKNLMFMVCLQIWKWCCLFGCDGQPCRK